MARKSSNEYFIRQIEDENYEHGIISNLHKIISNLENTLDIYKKMNNDNIKEIINLKATIANREDALRQSNGMMKFQNEKFKRMRSELAMLKEKHSLADEITNYQVITSSSDSSSSDLTIEETNNTKKRKRETSNTKDSEPQPKKAKYSKQ